jgi:hypothetical protein
VIGVAMVKREPERQRPARSPGATKRRRARRRTKARSSPAGSVFRVVFVDLLVRYRSECGLPPMSPVRIARMSDDELFASVRAARRARDAKNRT